MPEKNTEFENPEASAFGFFLVDCVSWLKIQDMRPLLFLALLFAQVVFSQELYVKTFGSEKDKPVLFLHGGPGYNSAGFEISTAQKLSDNGFFVIVYDRRGEGRSANVPAKFTFEETFADIDAIYDRFKLKKATLIGHSFGGMVGTLYTEKNPSKVNALVLVGAPVSLQESFDTIVNRCRAIYEAKDDKTNLNYLNMLSAMDKTTMEYASYCFGHAMQSGLYSAKNKTDDANRITSEIKQHPDVTLLSKMTIGPPKGFSNNEHYTTLDLSGNLKKLVDSKVKVFAIYGKDDGLYSAEQIEKLGKITGIENLRYLDNCSHNVFIDQQPEFLLALQNWAK